MPSYLITGGNLADRIQKSQEIIKKIGFTDQLEKIWPHHPDLLLIDSQTTIGIDQVRQIKHFLSLKPLEANLKVILLPQAEKLTIPAQNALLKILEEPPQNSLIILASPSKNQLLPTITSRCQTIHLQEKSEVELTQEDLRSQLTLLENALDSSFGQRISLTAEISLKSREEALQFCQKQILALHLILLQKIGLQTPVVTLSPHLAHLPVLFILRMLSQTIKTCRYLQNNVHPKLALENLFLSLPQADMIK